MPAPLPLLKEQSDPRKVAFVVLRWVRISEDVASGWNLIMYLCGMED
jgi:hypothetical protein